VHRNSPSNANESQETPQSEGFLRVSSFVPAMVERENASLLSGAASQSVGGQIVIETSGLSIRIPSDVSADHIERVLLAVRVNA